MDCTIDISNSGYRAKESLTILEYNGDPRMVPDDVQAAIDRHDDYQLSDFECGDWFVVVDGELVSPPNSLHPFQVRCSEDRFNWVTDPIPVADSA
jgi:hypothetical protein